MAISMKLPKVFGAEKGAPAADLDMPTTQVRAGATAGLRPARLGVDHGAASLGDLRDADAEAAAGHRPPAGRAPVPGAGPLDGHVPRARRPDALPRRPTRVARRGCRIDGDRNADALAASGARHGARVAGSGRRVRGAQGQSRPVQGGPRRAAERRRGEGCLARHAVRRDRGRSSSRTSARGGTASR